MLTSLALIFLAGLAAAALCQWCRLPRIIGMLFTGILLGPYVLNLLDPSILAISAELRQMALIIILLKAGLPLHRRSGTGRHPHDPAGFGIPLCRRGGMSCRHQAQPPGAPVLHDRLSA